MVNNRYQGIVPWYLAVRRGASAQTSGDYSVRTFRHVSLVLCEAQEARRQRVGYGLVLGRGVILRSFHTAQLPKGGQGVDLRCHGQYRATRCPALMVSSSSVYDLAQVRL